MKNSMSKCAGVGVLLLALGATPGSVSGQTATQNPASPAPKADEKSCLDSRALKEQLEGLDRTYMQDLQDNLARLKADIVKEVEMSSPELEKLRSLSAQLASGRGELQDDAAELAAQARELAAEAQEKSAEIFEQEPRVFVQSNDEGGWLGIEIGEVTPEKMKDLRLSSARGVVVAGVEPDSPAAKAGLKENDVIVQYDEQTVEGTVQFRRLVRETPPGRTVMLGISRNGAAQSISVELGDRNAFFEKRMEGKMRDFGNAYAFRTPNFNFQVEPGATLFDFGSPRLGISAEDLSGQLGEFFGAPDSAGVLVREVRAGTPAEKAGLKAGDVIIKVDGKPIRSLADLREQIRDKNDDKPVNLGVLRRGSELTVPVTVERPRPIEPMNLTHRAQL